MASLGELDSPLDELTPDNKSQPKTDSDEPVIDHLLLASMQEQAQKKGYAEGHAQGHIDGYAQGVEDAKRDAQEIANKAAQEQEGLIKTLFADLSTKIDINSNDLSKTLTLIALNVGKHFAGKAVVEDPEIIENKIRQLLDQQSGLIAPVRIRLHPLDANTIEKALSDELNHAGWEVVRDEGISRGGCRVMSRHTEIDGTWEHQQAQIDRLILEALG